MRCNGCLSDLKKECFSAHQRNKKGIARKCKTCCCQDALLPEDEKSNCNKMLGWLKSNGAEFPKVVVEEFAKGYRGAKARTRISKGSTFISIPHKCIMTLDKAKESKLGQILQNSGANIADHTFLAMFVLQERYQEDSFWQPYLKLLPKKYPNVPYFYDTKLLDTMRCTFAYDMLQQRKHSLEDEYKNLKEIIPHFYFSLFDFIWARTVVVTRVFGISAGGGEGLVPLADMLNHKPQELTGTRWQFDEVRNAFTIVATKPYLKGCEIFDSYGPKCNSRYLVNYGFTLPNNEANNQAAVFVDQSEIIKNNNVKALLIGRPRSFDDGYSGYNVLVSQNLEQRVTQKHQYRFQIGLLKTDSQQQHTKKITVQECTKTLFSALRVIFASDQDLKEIEQLLPYDHKLMKMFPNLLTEVDIPPLSVQNELLVIKELKNICQNRLNEFSAQEDPNLFPMFSPQRNIATLIQSEHYILSSYITLADTILPDTTNIYQVGKRLRHSNNSLCKTYYTLFWSQLRQ